MSNLVAPRGGPGNQDLARAPRDRAGRFVNWARTVATTPSAWRAPTSEEEVEAVVRAVAGARGRLRVVGAGHAWSAIAAPEDVAVTLDGLSGIVEVDHAALRVTVLGGTRLVALNAALADMGLALPIVGSIAAQSIAGLTATGTHGSSLTHGNLSSLVRGMRIVGGNGERVDLGEDDPRLDGARVHLGALGVVTRVTLAVAPAFRLAETIERLPLARAIADLHAIARSAEYVKVWWLPHTPDAIVFRYERTGEATSRWPGPGTQRWIDDHVMQRLAFPVVAAIERALPRAIPALNGLIAPTFVKARRVGPSALMLSTPMPLRHRETEAAIPVERGGEALDRLARLIERDGLRVNFPVEARFVRTDGGWLSPAQGRDTCQLGAYATDIPDAGRYLAGFWREMRSMAARPHWGKEMDHDAGAIAALYPLRDRFAALRDALDPDRVLGGAFHARVLGP